MTQPTPNHRPDTPPAEDFTREEVRLRRYFLRQQVLVPDADRELERMAAALDDGVSPVEAKEALYQTIPYVGMAKAYDFVLAANEVMAEKGIQLPLEGQSRTTPQNRLEKGNFRLSYRRDARFGARGTETYSGLPFGQLFRRLLYPRRFGFENPRTADFCNADFAWRR